MYKCASIFSLVLFFFTNISAMLPWQKTEVIKSIWVVPLLGSFGPVECPTYVTDTIYFKGTANLIGGSSYMPTVDRLMVNGDRYNLTAENQPRMDQSFTRHVLPMCSSAFTDSRCTNIGLNQMLITYDAAEDGTTYDNNIDGKKRTIALKQMENEQYGTLSYEIAVLASATKRSCVMGHRVYTQSHRNKSFQTTSPSHPGRVIHSTRKPHALFVKNGNLHTIKEEKLTLPILGLFLPTAFLIRYYDVQLTEQFTHPNHPAPCVKILWKNPFGWANVIRTVNGLFIIFVAYIALPYMYKMF